MASSKSHILIRCHETEGVKSTGIEDRSVNGLGKGCRTGKDKITKMQR
jgi:hypothetical protein